MSAAFCKFVFPDTVGVRFLEDVVACAILNAERTFGKAKVRVYASYTVAENPPRCLIDISSEVGRFTAETFVEMVIRFVGEKNFEVFHLDRWEQKGETDAE